MGYFDEIIKYLKTKNIEYSFVSKDGRINSAIDEEPIVNAIDELFKNRDDVEVVIPKAREWYDVALRTKDNFMPINVKISELSKHADNLNCKLGLYYTLTGKEPVDINNESSWEKVFRAISRDYCPDNTKDYYFLIANKSDNSDFFCNGLKQLKELTPNGSNLPFQAVWKNNREPVSRDNFTAADYLLSNLKKSVAKRSKILSAFRQLKNELDTKERGVVKAANNDIKHSPNEYFDEIVECLKGKNIQYSIQHKDGRLNSTVDEEPIVNAIDELFKNRDDVEVVIPKAREWYDVALKTKDNFIPINVKISELSKHADNLNCKLGLYYALTGKEPTDINNESSWEKVFRAISRDYCPDNTKDYYFLIANKSDNSDFFCNGLKQLKELTPNGSNLPFQAVWKNNREPVIRDCFTTSDYLFSTFEKSLTKRTRIVEAFDQLWKNIQVKNKEFKKAHKNELEY